MTPGRPAGWRREPAPQVPGRPGPSWPAEADTASSVSPLISPAPSTAMFTASWTRPKAATARSESGSRAGSCHSSPVRDAPEDGTDASNGWQALLQGRVDVSRAQLCQEARVEVRPDQLLGPGEIGHGAEEPGQLPAHRRHQGRSWRRAGTGRPPWWPGPARYCPANQCTRPRPPPAPRRARRTRSAWPPSAGPAVLHCHPASRPPRVPRRLRSQNQFISSRPSQWSWHDHPEHEHATTALTRDYGVIATHAMTKTSAGPTCARMPLHRQGRSPGSPDRAAATIRVTGEVGPLGGREQLMRWRSVAAGL